MCAIDFIKAVVFFWRGQENVNEEAAFQVLAEIGYPPEKVREMDFEESLLEKILYIEIPFKTLRKLGLRPSLLVGTSYVAPGLKFGDLVITEDRIGYFMPNELIPAFGYTVGDLVADGIGLKEIEVKDLKEDGYSLEKLKSLGFSLRRTKNHFSWEELSRFYTPKEFRREKVSAKYLIKFFSCKQLKEGGYLARALQEEAECSAKQLKEAGFPATKLRVGQMWYDPDKGRFIRGAWFPTKELKEAGFTPMELKRARISAKKMKEAGFAREDLKGVFVPWHLARVFT